MKPHSRVKAIERGLATGEVAGEEATMIYICDKCLRAGCWQGLFVCHEAGGAGIYKATLAECQALDREHASFYRDPDVDDNDTITPRLPAKLLQ